MHDFDSYEAAERTVAKFIQDAVNEIWYLDLHDVQSFYTNITAVQLIKHLEDDCGGLHPSELVNLPTEMLGYYVKAEGVPKYINKLEEAQRKLACASLPMTDDQLLAIASTSILASEYFPHQTDEWEALPKASKTWAAWKAHYRAAHIARKCQMLVTSKSMTTYGAANAVTPINDTISQETFAKLDGYLDNLAVAATTEKNNSDAAG